MAEHVPVMAAEVVEQLAPRRGGVYVDCTLGAGGHSRRIAAAMGQGKLFGFDKDPAAIALASAAVAAAGTEVEFRAVQADFAEAPRWLREQGIAQVDGVVADLGVSSMQLDRAERGFSFSATGPLDMRMDPRQRLTAEQVVNQFDERTLAEFLPFRVGTKGLHLFEALAQASASPAPTERAAAAAEWFKAELDAVKAELAAGNSLTRQLVVLNNPTAEAKVAELLKPFLGSSRGAGEKKGGFFSKLFKK